MEEWKNAWRALISVLKYRQLRVLFHLWYWIVKKNLESKPAPHLILMICFFKYSISQVIFQPYNYSYMEFFWTISSVKVDSLSFEFRSQIFFLVESNSKFCPIMRLVFEKLMHGFWNCQELEQPAIEDNKFSHLFSTWGKHSPC